MSDHSEQLRAAAERVVAQFRHFESGIEWVTNPSPDKLRDAIAAEFAPVLAAAVGAALEQAAETANGNSRLKGSGDEYWRGRQEASRAILALPHDTSALNAALAGARRGGHLDGLERAAKTADMSAGEDSKAAARRIRNLILNMNALREQAAGRKP